MERKRKVELFEQIRREYEFGCGTIIGVAEKFGVHRRMVRQAIECAMPPERKRPLRSRPKLERVRAFIDKIIDEDGRAPRKQRHTAHRIFERLRVELPTVEVSERTHLLPLQAEGFELAEESFSIVDAKGCIRARTNLYSTPLKPGVRCRVRVLPAKVEVFSDGRCVARHERCYARRQQVFDLEHYLDVLERKPGAFAGSKPLQQWRAQGRWTRAYDQLWQQLQRRHGATDGTRLMIELLQEGKRTGYERLTQAITEALSLGTGEAAAVRYLLDADILKAQTSVLSSIVCEVASPQAAAHFTRPLPSVVAYDSLLEARDVSREVA